LRRFRALKTFESPDLKSTYVKGMTYTVRDGNDLLAVFAEDWVQEGLVEYCGENEPVPPFFVAGQGIVK
jgi:hypothetical protein